MKSLRIFFQTFIHVLTVYLIIRLFRLDLFGILFAVIGGFILDLECIPTVRKIGLSGYWYLRTKVNRKPKLSRLHNLFTLTFSIIGSIFILTDWTFYLGIFFVSLFLHLSTDFIFVIASKFNPIAYLRKIVKRKK